jgi:hypothetical protein
MYIVSTSAENPTSKQEVCLGSFLFIFLDTDPHLASVCVISISFPFRDMSCVCVWELVYVCACVHKFGVATNHGKFKV